MGCVIAELSVSRSFFNQFVRYIYNELNEDTAGHRKLILEYGSLFSMAPLSSELRRNATIIKKKTAHHFVMTSSLRIKI